MELDSRDMSLDVQPKYTIVVPAFQEESVIEISLSSIHSYLTEQKILDITEVIVVAADSTDRTAQISKDLSVDFPYFQLIEPGRKRGKGRDVRIGMLAARGEYVVFTDADLATPIHHLGVALEKLEGSDDVVIGVRDLRKIHTGYRSMLSRCANKLTRILVLPSISDTQCGFKGFHKSVSEKIFTASTINGWSFDIEVLALAKMNKYTIGEIFIGDWDDPKLDQGFVGENPIKAASTSLWELFVIRYRLTTGKYKG